MALQQPQLNEIVHITNLSQVLLSKEGELNQVDILFNGATNWAALVTDQAIAAVPELAASGVTAQNILDAIFVLKEVRTKIMEVNLPALVILAHL
jgi:hypothetical protein